MTKSPIPGNEVQRLQALESYQIADTLPEQAYDDITSIASVICNTPMAVISILDSNKQFFKSAIGISTRETPREIALCAHAIMHPDQLMMVPDLRTDDRFSDNPMVTGDPHIVFYAGMPMVTDDGFALGTICVLDNQPKQLTGIQQDALKRLARQVINLMELRKKNELLAASQQTISRYAKQMENFAFMASHDLREPLRMINSFMLLLRKKYSGQLDDIAQKYIGFAVDGSQRATVLIDDLLAYASQEPGTPVIQAVNLNKLLKDIVQLQAPVIESIKAQIRISEMPVIQGEWIPVKTVFQNLIANALKFRRKDAPPEIFIDATDQGEYWLFSVSDNGIGIPAEHLEVIFEPFRRLHPSDKFSGSGIGLAACKKIIEHLGGRIWAEAAGDGGTAFFFTYSKQAD